MKAEELRMCNLIYEISHDNGEYGEPRVKEVSASDIGRIHYDGSTDRDCVNNPIPLTEEWLIKFGFEIYNSCYKNITKFLLKEEYRDTKHATIGINPVTEDNMLKLSNVFGVWFFNNGHHEIKHVHQLQNLYFALTNEELKLK
jgi:hypothetical protein